MPSDPSKPRPVPQASPSGTHRGSPAADQSSRAASIARLASTPVGSPPRSQNPTPVQAETRSRSPLAGAATQNFLPGPGQSALASALQGSIARSPPRFGTPPVRTLSPAPAGTPAQPSGVATTYGSFDSRLVHDPGAPRSARTEDLEVVRRHLVEPSNLDGGSEREHYFPFHDGPSERRGRTHSKHSSDDAASEFSSLQLQGGDTTRQIYKFVENSQTRDTTRRHERSKSMQFPALDMSSEGHNAKSINVPGGFRRYHVSQNAGASSKRRSLGLEGANENQMLGEEARKPRYWTANFLEFLTLYGHFAGEDLDEEEDDDDDDDDDEGEQYFPDGFNSEDEDDIEESSALLRPTMPGSRRKASKKSSTQGTTTSSGAALLLLKSFVGTGVLFLPRAYLNGGFLFSNIVLLGVATLSYFCFVLLVSTRLKVEASFGDMGKILYGTWLRALIQISLILSQIGFVSAYIVFVSANLQSFVLAVSNCRTRIDIKMMILMQLVVLLPCSLIRKISKLKVTVIVAEVFILLGLIYLYYADIRTIIDRGGIADIVNFNPRDWTLFVGTALFTFEGIGLVIPVQESMIKPSEFKPVLAGVMIIITVIFISMGALSYAAFGSATKTVILLNLPQDNKFVNAVQLLYSLAILLSTPLQLFPAIGFIEQEIFPRSGKRDPYMKWYKNLFRFFLTVACALIAWGGADELDKFVSLVGSFACVPLVYCYPVSCQFGSVLYLRPILGSFVRAESMANLQDLAARFSMEKLAAVVQILKCLLVVLQSFPGDRDLR